MHMSEYMHVDSVGSREELFLALANFCGIPLWILKIWIDLGALEGFQGQS